MRRPGRWSRIVGAVLIILAVFNIYTMMTMYSQHTCNTGAEITGSTSIGDGGRNLIWHEAQQDEIHLHRLSQRTSEIHKDSDQQFQRGKIGGEKLNNAGKKWLYGGWEGDDQMAGLVAPPERKVDMAAQLGVEGVLQHQTGHQHNMRHPTANSMILISQMNGTIDEWPWPSALTTHNKCEQRAWEPVETMPDVSVIITFHETETISHLLRTVHALVQRTPKVLLKEIILVADNTKKDDLGDVLDVYIKSVFGHHLVKLIRSTVTLGLIKARLLGVSEAAGSVLVFMDSHMEVQHHWLEPLLHEIIKDRKTLASSFLDWFELTANGRWKYRHGDSSWVTYFDWTFTFGFQELGPALDKRSDSTEAIRSPVTVGGMFAIEKKFFEEIGSYDRQMTRWGGENVDLAIRVWLCGGRVLNVPCSHAAHFESATSRSYRDTWTEDIHKNYQRVAEVLLGPYKKYFYENFPHLRSKNPGDLTERLNIMKQCKRTFHWFLDNVIPQLGLPDVDSIAHGGVECLGMSGYCLDSRDLRHPGLNPCLSPSMQAQNYYWSLQGNLRMPIHMYNVVRQTMSSDVSLYLEEHTKLFNTSKGTVWFHVKGHHIIDTDSGKCLEGQTSYDITLKPCEPDNKRQRWRFRTYNPSYFQLINSESVPGIDSSLLDKFSKYIHLAQKKRLKQHSRERRELDDRNPRINNVQSLQGSNFVEKVLKK